MLLYSVDCCQLQEIPKELSRLTQLKSLNCKLNSSTLKLIHIYKI